MLNGLRTLLDRVRRKDVPGVDVSGYQGEPGTWQQYAGDISWAAVKFTELEPDGTRYVNPFAETDWSYLYRHDKGRIAYFFGHPSVDAQATADFFIEEVTKLGLRDVDAVALDLEVTDGLPPGDVDAWAAEVMSDLRKRLDRPPVLYTYLSFAQAGNTASLGEYPLWVSNPSRPAGRPEVPPPWKTWAIHQYEITGPIDRDVANYRTQEAMNDALGKKPEKPPPPPPPAPPSLGGSIAGGLSTARWDSGQAILAGLGTDGHIQASRLVSGAWTPWRKVSPTKSRGTPGLMAWGPGHGYLFYTDDGNTVRQLTTKDYGQNWDY